ncbi:chromosome segregation in meiosis- protein [Lithohypha guttulata]|uniref:Chromosome segregation in meiosis protein n=1 Tax=Lithohypha guttulata TaxID=1690604 RepID=A0AAN7YDT1_9EURO|nr:chromosome segregation in meiosis- protein [Lithohypha guttulata]
MAADPLTRTTVDELMLEDAAFDTDDDPFADRPSRNTERDDKTTLSPRKRKAEEDVFGGNIDEEVKITRQRKKIPKLDADRLLSEPGLPKLRTQIRSGQMKRKLRLKGKGHEFDDVAKLLNFYQNWLDGLYPRAKFADALQLVERAGHTKKLQMYRKSWIDESKPGHIMREDMAKAVDEQDRSERSALEAQQLDTREVSGQSIEEEQISMFFGDAGEDDIEPGGPDDDELDMLLAQDQQPNHVQSKRVAENVDSEGEDDLDALLAQEASRKPTSSNNAEKQTEEEDDDDDDDDLSALLSAHSHNGGVEPVSHKQHIDVQEDSLDNGTDELDKLIDNQTGSPEPDLPGISVTRTTSSVNELDEFTNRDDVKINQQHDDSTLAEGFFSSSPIPNGESQ